MASKTKDRKEIGKAATKGGRGSHPNSRKNLEKGMAKPGDVLNPAGKPPGTKDRATVLNRWLEVVREIDGKRNPSGEKVKGTVEDEIMLALIGKALKGDVAAIREVMDTRYGKLKEKTELSNPDGSGLLDPLLSALDKAYGDRKG